MDYSDPQTIVTIMHVGLAIVLSIPHILSIHAVHRNKPEQLHIQPEIQPSNYLRANTPGMHVRASDHGHVPAGFGLVSAFAFFTVTKIAVSTSLRQYMLMHK